MTQRVSNQSIDHPSVAAKQRLLGYALLLFTMLVWGSFTIISRFSIVQVFTPWDVSAIRFATGLVILLPILIARGELGLLSNPRMIVLALFGGLFYTGLVFLAFSFAPAAHAAIWMNGCLPFWMAISSYLVLQEKATRHTYLSLGLIALGLSSMMLLMWYRHAYALNIGDLFFFLAGGCWGIYTAFMKRWSFSVWQIMSGVAIISGLFFLPMYLLFLPKKIMAATYWQIAGQAVFQGIVVMILAMLTYLGAVQRLGAIKTGTVLALAPLLAAVVAVPLLHEPLQIEIVVGLVAVGLAALQPWRLWLKD